MGDLHLVLRPLNLSTLNAGILGWGGWVGWLGGVVAHEILVSAQGPLDLGFWVWALGVWGLGLTMTKCTD